jgi:hypothetical protein
VTEYMKIYVTVCSDHFATVYIYKQKIKIMTNEVRIIAKNAHDKSADQ